ncbi:protein of unknown function [Candidatus Methylacidiphilum fumarolicum]|uniref:IS200/IS605 family transposase n=1 Tax=Candidatus Methylacidiphilum fumarolicum TaxID=591154 RepID=A0ABM9IBR8_9BACT|nr:protein of unknown function [Candidatus Methylacidiphilum fumarolicum]
MDASLYVRTAGTVSAEVIRRYMA